MKAQTPTPADGMLWFTSEPVPVDGTTNKTKLVVSAPEVAICLFEGAPTFEVITQQHANELKVLARLRNYVGIVTRHKAGTAYVNNCNAYVTTNV